MATTRIGIDGVDDFLKALDEIGDKVALKTIKKASETAAKPLLQETIQQCPVGESTEGHTAGTLRESIKLKKTQQRKKGFAGAQIVCGKGFFKGETYYGGFVEFGHKTRSGSHVPANPFMSRAIQIKKHDVLNAMSDGIKNGIEEAARKVKVKNDRNNS